MTNISINIPDFLIKIIRAFTSVNSSLKRDYDLDEDLEFLNDSLIDSSNSNLEYFNSCINDETQQLIIPKDNVDRVLSALTFLRFSIFDHYLLDIPTPSLESGVPLPPSTDPINAQFFDLYMILGSLTTHIMELDSSET